MSEEQPPYGGAGAEPSPQGLPPPPYGQSGATWPNSQPLPPPSGGHGVGQPPPGSGPGGGPGGYGGPYIPPIPQKSNAGKIVAIVVGVVLLLTCGGCGVFGLALFDAGQDVIRDIESFEPPTVRETVSVGLGEGFVVGGVEVDSGWTIQVVHGLPHVSDMRGRAATDPSDVVALHLTFYRGDRAVGEASCGGTVEESGEVQIACTVSDKRARKADRVEVESLL